MLLVDMTPEQIRDVFKNHSEDLERLEQKNDTLHMERASDYDRPRGFLARLRWVIFGK